MEYLRTGNQRLCKQAADAVRVALDAADQELQNAARLQSIAEANVPKLGFFARAASCAAAQSASQKHAQAVAAYIWDVANEATEVAGLLAAEKGVIVGTDERLPSLLPPGTAQAAGRGAQR